MDTPLQRLVADILCGQDPQCRGELEDLAATLRSLDTQAASLPPPSLTGPNGDPIMIQQVSNLDEMRTEARRLAGGNGLAEYLVRRKLYLSLRSHAKPHEGQARCPVCGQPPRLIVMARVDQGIFSGHEPRARCTCGMEWPVEEWRCPSCGTQGRDSFNIYIVKPGLLEVRVCRACGHPVAVTWSRPSQVDVLLANLALAAIEGGEDG